MLIPSGQVKGKRRLTALCQLAILLACCATLPAFAQNNPYKIDDSLYLIYERADKIIPRPEVLQIADTLYREALILDDKKAQCLAYVIPLEHYKKLEDGHKMEEAADRLREIARTNNYLQYYYHAWNCEIVYHLNHNQSLLALQKAEKMKKQAFADKYPFGIMSCIRTIGHIYTVRGNADLAAKYYKEALDYMLKNVPDQDPYQNYIDLSQYYRSKNDFNTALEYCLKAVESAKTEQSRTTAMMEKCMVLYSLERPAEFNACYKEIVRKAKDLNLTKNNSLLKINIYKCILDKQYEQAHAYADQQLNKEALSFHAFIYEVAGDYRNALLYKKEYQNFIDSINAQLQVSDIAELNAQIGTERLKLENLQTATRYRSILFTTIISFLLLALLFLTLYLYRKRRVNRELRHKNRQLSEARNQAESANNMKTLFLQNMSHEIRTPLNSIVGFSQLITDPGMELPPEEKLEFGKLIQCNSELLLTLVDDVLSVAELESNNYTMHMEQHNCNELCRKAIATVEWRRPEGVKLYYTSEADSHYQLLTDGHRVCQVLINFLTNAEKHTTRGEIRLHCSLTENPGRVTFSVADTGTGIAPEYAETIFERFKKLDNFQQGTGLGLNICRLIAERLQGEVRLDKEYTDGARFLFILPIRHSAEEEKEEEEEE